MHRAATAASNTPMIVSQNTSTPIERSPRAQPARCGGSSTRRRASTRAGRSLTRADRRLHRRRRHRRSAGVVLRAFSARSESRRRGAGERSGRRRAGADAAAAAGERSGARIDCRPAALVHVALSRRPPPDPEGAAARERHSHRRRRQTLHRARHRRHHRLEPRRPVDGLRPVDARGAARDRRGHQRHGFRCSPTAATGAAATS